MKLTQEDLAKFIGEKLDGINYDQHALEVVAQAHKFYYDRRTIVNSDVSKKRKVIEDLSAQLPEGFDPKSVDEAHIKEIGDKITASQLNAQKLETAKTDKERITNHISELKAELKREEENLKTVDATIKSIKVEDTTALSKELSTLESQRSLVYTAKQIDEARKELDGMLTEQGGLDEKVKILAKEVPQKLIEKAKLPIKGLSLVDDDVLVNGVALDNLSSSEQLKFALEITRQLNQEFKVINIDGIETLDKESFELFLKEIKDDDFQYFLTKVDGETIAKNGYNLVEVEDGEIKNG